MQQRERTEHSERLRAIRARVTRSLEDPRADLTGEEMDARLEALFRKAHERG